MSDCLCLTRSRFIKISILCFLDVELPNFTFRLQREPEVVDRDKSKEGVVSDIQIVVEFMCGVPREDNSYCLNMILPADPGL